jgi:hypothetical protein
VKIVAVKTRQIFVVGLLATGAAMLLPAYEHALAGIGALVILAVVVAGFFLHPHRDVFYVRASVKNVVHGHFCVEHELIAVRVEVARLWLLFVPTFSAVAFLLVAFARGSIFDFSLMDRFFEYGTPAYFLSRIALLPIISVLSTWVNERWVLRDAAASSAHSITIHGARVQYAFLDEQGEYYGGDGFPFGIPGRPVLATLVMYNVAKPDLNKIGMALLFHRLVIIGHGLTDLGEATVAANTRVAQATR